MMHEFGHTSYTDKHVVELVVASLATNIVFRTIYVYINPKMT
jgi:hypothetical protein